MPLLKSGAKHRRGTGLLAKASEGALDAELADLYSQQLCVSPLSECAESQADGPAASESLARLRTHQIDRWRSALLGTIAASSLFVYGGRPARADCSGASTTLTCTGTIAGTVPPGVVNGGIDVPTGYTTLNVNHLDADITPASGVDGILVVSTGDVAIVSNTTDGTVAHAISVTGVGADGITARSSAGAVTVDSTGDITSTNGRGVAAYSRGIAADVSIASVGAISAMSDGINAFSYTRAVTVHSTGDITSTNGQGISAANHEDGSVLVTSVGAINAYSDGIYARSWSALSTGAITVKSTGDITSAIGRGIVAFSDGASDISVTTTGNVNAAYEGVSAISSAGSATVNSAGDITSTNGVGIIAANFAYGAGDISITSKGDIRTNFEGINAFSYSGAVTVNNTGDITSTNGRGVAAYSEGTAADISITSVGAINAYSDGIYARSWGALSTGAIAIDSTGDITSTNGHGIVATNVGATDVSVTSAGNINAYSDGIYARSTNGAATVDSTGDITSAKGQGIYARSFGAGDVSVTSVGSLETASAGIRASSSTGAVTVDSTGDITSTNGQGIVAANFAAGAGDVSVTSVGAINAYSDGIYALSYNGAVTVDSTGDITSATGRGIYARNLISGAGNVSITSAGVINAYSDGVYARTQTSAIAIDSTGDITSTNGHGIVATNVGATDVSVTSAGNINAYSDGIYARSSNGAATVDSTGDITSATGRGVIAFNSGGSEVSVTSNGDINAKSDGIFAASPTGAVTVDSTGDITSTNGQGIVAANFADVAGDVSVTSVGAINAYSDGIYALSYNGAVTVDSTGDITSTNVRGIYANNVTNGNVSVTSIGDISANSDGISARSVGGNVSVTSTGDIVANQIGIYARSSGPTTNGNVSVTVLGGEVTGAVTAIEISDGAFNSVLNRGTLKSSSGTALIGGSGSETIDNYGTIIGNIDLGGGANAFTNHMGGTFRSGASANLGAGNVLTNSGTLSPFGPGTIGTTDVTGNFVQTASGTFAVDVDLAGHAADRLNATG